MLCAYLIGQYDYTLGEAKRLMEGVPCERCADLVGTSKHPAWIIGHLAVAGDLMNSMAGGESRLESWQPLYTPGGEGPKADRAMYPKKAELMDALAERHVALTSRVKGMSDADFAKELPYEAYRSFFPTVGHAAVYMMAAHEMYHLGQLSVWRNVAGIK